MEDSPEATLERRRVSAARQGDEAAFGELMQANYEAVFRTVIAIIRNEHDARDLCQEIWVKAWHEG
ncbi:sigma factor [bacterium]|nr:sigma factor [bacterium]